MAQLRAILIAAALLALAAAVDAEEWLPDGGFEGGTAGWFLFQAVPADCEPHAGTGALGVQSGEQPFARATRDLAGPFPAATYTFSGWTRVESGNADLSVTMAFATPHGTLGGITVPVSIPTGEGYTHFSVSANASFPPQAIILNVILQSEDEAVVCIDSLQLTTPGLPATPTSVPDPTATPEPGPSPSPTPGTGSSPSLPPVVLPTSTTGPSYVFINGGFEQGLAGWRKHGGDLTTTPNARSGAAAGLLVSSTASTKWAYQSVAIDPAQHYEFAAYLQPDGGVRQAYLRISWYESPDTSGGALATTDSTHHVTGPQDGFVFLTTGSVQPPPNTRSARVRAVLTPWDEGPASLAIDDASFGTVPPPTPTPAPTATETPSPAPTADVPMLQAFTPTPEPEPEEQADGGPPAGTDLEPVSPTSAAGAVPQTAVPTTPPTTGPVAEVAGVRTGGTGAPAPSEAMEDEFGVTRPSSGTPWPWIIGAALLAVGLGGTYAQKRLSR